jgi:hypothetical protein
MDGLFFTRYPYAIRYCKSTDSKELLSEINWCNSVIEKIKSPENKHERKSKENQILYFVFIREVCANRLLELGYELLEEVRQKYLGLSACPLNVESESTLALQD